MAERSKRIQIYDKEKIEHINPETLKLFQKYQIDMSIRDLSQNTILQYNADLTQWFIFMYDQQFNLSVLDATDSDLEEFLGIDSRLNTFKEHGKFEGFIFRI